MAGAAGCEGGAATVSGSFDGECIDSLTAATEYAPLQVDQNTVVVW